MNFKFHKNCENTGKSLKISRERCNFVSLTFIFAGSHEKFCLVLNSVKFSLGKITQFHGGFRLNPLSPNVHI